MTIKLSRKPYDVFVSWFSYYVKFSKPVIFISGLILAHGLVDNMLVAVLIAYLTNALNMNLPKAAMVVNVQEGLSSILAIFAAHISDAYLGRFKTLVVSAVTFMIGLGLFCTAAYADSIEKKVLFVALFFLVLGISGRDVPLKAFLADQLRSADPIVVNDEEQVEVRRQVWWSSSWFVSTIVATFVFATTSWTRRTIISIATMFAGLLCFLLGNSYYTKKVPTGSVLTTTFRVFKSAILKRHLKYPSLPNQFYENESGNIVLSPDIPFLRWLDKAAIIESSSSSIEEQETDGKFCTVAEVRETKLLFTMIPMWTVFLVYSLVEAAGNTFFVEQFFEMDDHLGEIKHVPVTVFVIIKGSASFTASCMCSLLLPRFQFLQTRQRLAILVQIGLGRMCSLFCCIAAWRVENFRLKKFRLNTGISIFWLTPQFVLLGSMEGFAEEGLCEFFITQVSESMRNYGEPANEFILGVGKFISAIIILIFKDWFRNDMSSSHLDKYYSLLALLSLLNFLFFVYTAARYGNHHIEMENVDEYNSEDGFRDQSVSPLLPDKSYSFPLEGSQLPQSSFQSSERLMRRWFTVVGCEKDVELSEMRLIMDEDLAA